MVSEKDVSNLEPEPINNPFHSQKKQLITKIDKIKVRTRFYVLKGKYYDVFHSTKHKENSDDVSE